jgi:hypothetical protein
MKSLYKIIKEEYIRFLKESYDDDDIDYEFFERESNIKQSLFDDFLFNNNSDFTKHVPWTVVPFPRLKKIWENYMSMGIVRDTRGLEYIEDIMIENTLKIYSITMLLGHTSYSPDDDYEEFIGHYVDEQLNCILKNSVDINQLEIPFGSRKKNIKKTPQEPCDVQVNPHIQQFVNDNQSENVKGKDLRGMVYDELTTKFTWYYTEDPESGQAYISDYGMQPLMTLVGELRRETKPEDKLVTIDKMLNVVHPRSDMASWFIEGGSSSLSKLSGYGDIEYGDDSAISGSRKISA